VCTENFNRARTGKKRRPPKKGRNAKLKKKRGPREKEGVILQLSKVDLDRR